MSGDRLLSETAPWTAAEDELTAGFRSLPKVELHAHLGGSIRVSTVRELLIAQGRSEAEAETRAAAMVIPRDEHGVPLEPAPFEGFQIVKEAKIDTPELCKRCVCEYLEDCAADGVVYVELRTGGEDLDWMKTILEGFEDAKRAGIDCIARLILSIKRDKPASLAEKVVDNAIALKDSGVVAVDFCGVDTRGNPFTEEFAVAVRRARAAGLAFVPHFAELTGEEDLLNILDECPSRLGHAVFMDENPEVAQRIRESRIPVECCLVNNLNTMKRDGHVPDVFVGPAARYHRMFSKWIAEGHPIALCCDNRTHTGSLSDNYRLAASFLGTSAEEVKTSAWRLASNAVDHILAGDEVKDELHRRLASHPWRPEVKEQMEARKHSHCRNSMSGLKWTPRANVDIKQTDFEHAEALLDPAYPEHVENLLAQAPFYYYVTSFLNVTREDNSRHVSTVFEFLEPVCLCGFRIRGENYSNMRHMPKCVKLFCTNDIDYGPKGDWWREVACVEAKMQRGWQMFVSQDVLVADAQRLSDSANDVVVRGPPKYDMPEWKAIEGSACFQLHNKVDFTSVPWTLSAPAKYYRLDVVDINGGYIALAEINFLEVARTVLQISARQSLLDKASYFVEFSLLSGDLDCAVDMHISAKVSDMMLSFKERTSLQTPAAACLVLPCGALLDQHSSDMTLYDIFGSTLAELQ